MMEEEHEERKEMKFEDWDEVLDAKLLYNLYDDFECRLAALSDKDADGEAMLGEKKMERVMQAIVMFTARAVATCDTALVITGSANPNDVALAFIEYFIHTFGHVRQDWLRSQDDDEQG